MMIITVARKPSLGSTTACVLDNGCGGLNINDTRIRFASEQDKWKPSHSERLVYKAYLIGKEQKHEGERLNGQQYAPTVLDSKPNDNGRWPGNLLLVQSSKEKMDEQSGIRKSGAMDSITKGGQFNTYGKQYPRRVVNPASEGGASRFFKVFK